MGKSVKETIFDRHMVKQYISRCFQLKRFICYLEKREAVIKFGESIVEGKTGKLNKTLFQELFVKSNPPNHVLSHNDVWNYFKKKYNL